MTVTISILGAPGSGKSTISKLLANKLNASLHVEPWEENEYIPRSIAGEPVTFQAQQKMIELTTKQEIEASQSGKPYAIIDGGREQTMGFARMYGELGTLRPSEYQQIACSLIDSYLKIAPPDIMVYLNVSPHIAIERIRSRGRSFESAYTEDFIELLQRCIMQGDYTRVIAVDANGTIRDVLRHLERVITSQKY